MRALVGMLCLAAMPALAQDEGSDGVRDALELDDEGFAACVAALEDLGATFRPAESVIEEGDRDCGILRPIEVSEILPGIALSPAITVRCPTARALAEWTRDFVIPATGVLDDRSTLERIDTGSGYVCRRRNNQPDGKLSEHAFGNAVDVMAFAFAEGPPVPIMPREREGSRAEAFQDAVRATACLSFPTVLGPGSDEYHDDHLHLDVKARDGGFRLCQ